MLMALGFACTPGGPDGEAGAAGGSSRGDPSGPRDAVRVATYNIWQLSTPKVDSVDAEGRGIHPQLRAAARVVKAVRPDILVLNEVDLARTPAGALDTDDLGRVVRHFVDRYLAVGPDPLEYPYVFMAPSNTGELSGLDLNRDGTTGGPGDVGTRAYGDDSWGYGEYPGQYAMAVVSRFPFDTDAARTFRLLPWSELPGNHLPHDFYGQVADRLRLSSKSHWDVPVRIGEGRLHLWVSHPTPTGFDGPEDRNGLRNYDEIGFWVRYLEGAPGLRDDQGREGGFAGDGPFVVAGDLNSAPDDDDVPVDGRPGILQLLEHPGIQDPDSLQGRPTFRNGGRIDYVLPSAGLEVLGAGVMGGDGLGELEPDEGSDHYLVWADLRWPPEADG